MCPKILIISLPAILFKLIFNLHNYCTKRTFAVLHHHFQDVCVT